jgi:hemerythrin-like domain-containing protein
LRTVEWQHIVAEAAHWLLNTMGEDLVQAGRFETPQKRARFARLVEVLWHLYQEHFRLEEEVVLPLAARVLPLEELQTIVREMLARRSVDTTV